MTTPLFAAPLLLGYAAARGEGRRAAASLVGGAAVFAATWGGVCCLNGWPALDPFVYAWQSFSRSGGGGGLAAKGVFAAKELFGLALWIGPWLLLAPALALGRRWRRPEPRDIFVALGLFLTLGYTAFGGLLFGFPKYQAPALALLALAAASAAPEKARPGPWAAVVAVLALLQMVFLADPVLSWRYRLREAAALGGGFDVRSLAGPLLLYIGAAAIVLAAWRREAKPRPEGSALLLAWTLSWQLAQTVTMLQAPYHTGYLYGAQGFRDAVESLRDCEGRVIGTGEFQHALGRGAWVPDKVFNDPALLAEALRSKDASCLVYGVATNTVAQVRDVVAAPAVVEALMSYDARQTRGSFFIHKRHPMPLPARKR